MRNSFGGRFQVRGQSKSRGPQAARSKCQYAGTHILFCLFSQVSFLPFISKAFLLFPKVLSIFDLFLAFDSVSSLLNFKPTQPRSKMSSYLLFSL